MKLLNILKKKSPECWTDISELPLHNWCMVHKHSDTKYIFIAENYSKLKQNEASNKAFEMCYEQYFNKFIIDRDFDEWMSWKKRIAVLEAEAYTGTDKSLLTMAMIEQQRFDTKYPKPKDVSDLEKTVAIVEKNLGFMINRKEMSVDSFYEHLRIFVKDGK